jgi:hypothetical protein
VAWLSQLAGNEVTLSGNVLTHGDFALEILAPFTSSAPLADVVLAFVVIVLYLRGECRRADLPWLAAALLGSIVLSELRLTFMARNYVDYHWWHYEAGMTIYVLAELAVAAFFALHVCVSDLKTTTHSTTSQRH